MAHPLITAEVRLFSLSFFLEKKKIIYPCFRSTLVEDIEATKPLNNAVLLCIDYKSRDHRKTTRLQIAVHSLISTSWVPEIFHHRSTISFEYLRASPETLQLTTDTDFMEMQAKALSLWNMLPHVDLNHRLQKSSNPSLMRVCGVTFRVNTHSVRK